MSEKEEEISKDDSGKENNGETTKISTDLFPGSKTRDVKGVFNKVKYYLRKQE